jgi:outer membrane protein assembly factor BamB
MRRIVVHVLPAVAALAACVLAAAQPPAPAGGPAEANWPQFRGAFNAGLAGIPPADLPAAFAEKDFRWNVAIGGTGYGSPAVWGDRAFLLTCEENTGLRRVVCVAVDDGKVLWQKDYRFGVVKHNKDNSLAASTPAVDAARVIVCWASPKAVMVVALDHSGKELWQRDLGAHKTQHGPSVTPILYEGTVYVANDNEGPSAAFAIDAASGKVKWKVDRPSGKDAYGTPLIYRPAGGAAPRLVLSSSAAGLTAYDLKTGKQLWTAPEANPERVVCSPIQAGDLVVSSSGTGQRGKWLIAVRPPASPGGRPETAWKIERDAPYVPTSLAVGGLLFAVQDTGGIACYRAGSGELVWQDKLPGKFYGSPVCAAGRIYVISRDGTMFCYAAAEKFQLLGKTNLGEPSFATPVFAGNRMLLRTHGRLICAEKKG